VKNERERSWKKNKVMSEGEGCTIRSRRTGEKKKWIISQLYGGAKLKCLEVQKE